MLGSFCDHLVCLPVPEKVDGSIHPPLDHSPATGVVPLVAPHLHESVGVLRLHQVHTAGSVALFQSLQTVFKRTWTDGIKMLETCRVQLYMVI